MWLHCRALPREQGVPKGGKKEKKEKAIGSYQHGVEIKAPLPATCHSQLAWLHPQQLGQLRHTGPAAAKAQHAFCDFVHYKAPIPVQSSVCGEMYLIAHLAAAFVCHGENFSSAGLKEAANTP